MNGSLACPTRWNQRTRFQPSPTAHVGSPWLSLSEKSQVLQKTYSSDYPQQTALLMAVVLNECTSLKSMQYIMGVSLFHFVRQKIETGWWRGYLIKIILSLLYCNYLVNGTEQ